MIKLLSLIDEQLDRVSRKDPDLHVVSILETFRPRRHTYYVVTVICSSLGRPRKFGIRKGAPSIALHNRAWLLSTGSRGNDGCDGGRTVSFRESLRILEIPDFLV